MPEQTSRRGNVITQAPFEAPFENQIVRLGVDGLNLKDARDVVPPTQLTRMTNVTHVAGGALTGRPGQTSQITNVATPHHAIRKFRDPQAGLTKWVIAGGTQVYLGTAGAASLRDTGYSGDPVTLVPVRPPLSGDPWMLVADRAQTRKLRFDGLALPVGLTAPTSAPLLTTGDQRTPIEGFDPNLYPDFTSPVGNWTSNPGTDFEVPPGPTDQPTIFPGGATFNLIPTPANIEAETGFYSYWNLPKVLNLDNVGGTAASDDDFIHLEIMFGNPKTVAEVRLYFVVSETFVDTALPGTGAGNADFYVKAFRPGDFARWITPDLAQADAAEIARINTLRNEGLTDRQIEDVRRSWAVRRAATDPARSAGFVAGKGADEYVHLGVVGVPLRRRDFLRVGSTEFRDWSTVTGLVVYMQANALATGENFVTLLNCYLTGGSGPDAAEPGAQSYDMRYTHYDPRTGAESNGSPEMAEISRVDPLRATLTAVPAAYTAPVAENPSDIRQRFYVRGGSIIDDWYFVGVNSSNGGSFQWAGSDEEATGSGATVPTDHFRPVPTVNDAGTTVLASPLPAMWGPIEGMILGCGDPYRPGHLYFSLPDAPDHWAADGNLEVCAPSEELLHGGILGSQAFVFSRERLYLLYPNLSGTANITASPSLCKRGLWARWAFCVGPDAIYFVAEDGIFRTSGGPEEWLSELIDPLFKGETVHDYRPINMAAGQALRLTVHESKLYFLYQDADAVRQCLVYDLLRRFWRHYRFGKAPSVVQGDDEDLLLIGTQADGAVYQHVGTSDAGTAISATVRTGSLSGGRREEKLFGDQILDADRAGTTITVQNFLNEEAVANAAVAITAGGRDRYILDVFGSSPQIGRSIATEIHWSTTAAPPTLYQLGYAITLQPDATLKRVTNWDDLGHPDECWVTGITLDCDTSNDVRTIRFERDFNGVKSTMAERQVLANGRHKLKFSWDALPANMVRINPDGDSCLGWLLYRADWIWQPEPPRIAKWDIHFENAWDQYYTGLDLYCDTGGQEKRIEVSVDEQVLTNFQTGLSYFPVVANGRRVVHLTFTAGRGHVFRFRALDDFPGLLYDHRWHLQEEPSEQANWNQNFSLLGSRADKWLKAVIFECDTFGQGKQVAIQADGVTVETITVQTSGRLVVQRALTVQQLGRVWRMYPVDGNPGRLYSAQPVFDEEPFCLTRWETQELNHDLPGRFAPLYAQITLKSAHPVTLTVQLQHNQSGHLTTREYTIPATGSVKQRRFVGFEAGAGWLVKYLLTSASAFWLYQEESEVVVQPWGAGDPIHVRVFGNSDNDRTRSMTNAVMAAGRSGGGTS